MPVATAKPAAAPAIRPFTIETPEADLEEVRARIKATCWPDKETVEDQSQGVQLATMQALARYWATDYDWRKVEAKLKALPQFITTIDGLDIHFIHVAAGLVAGSIGALRLVVGGSRRRLIDGPAYREGGAGSLRRSR